jgi:hypothetical protein
MDPKQPLTLESLMAQIAQLQQQQAQGQQQALGTIQGRRQELQQREKTFTDRLSERRAQFEQANQVAGDRFSGALSADVPVRPADVFGAFQSFQRAGREYVEPLETQLSGVSQELTGLTEKEAGLQSGIAGDQIKSLTDIASLLEKTKQEPESLSDLLTLRKAMVDQKLDTTKIDEKLKSIGVNIGEEKPKSKEELEVARLAQEIIDADTKPITGNLHLGGVPLFNRTSVNTTKAKIEQLKGKLALAMRERLRGQGTITDKETEMIEKSVAALGTAQSDEAFQAELERIRDDFGGTSTTEGSLDDLDEQLINKYKGK